MSVRFGPTTALAGIDLSISTGERVVLVGPSGAGKSTLLGVLLGLVKPTEGTVEVLGSPLVALSRRALRSHRSRVGSIGQDPELPGQLAVIHNVNAGRLGQWSTVAALASLIRPTGRAEAQRVLDQVGLDDKLLARTDTLSGGERQRVAVARVLRQEPSLIVADEPTSSVDPRLSDEIMKLLCEANTSHNGSRARATLVVSVHDPELARRHGTRIIGLRHGTIAFDRPAGEVSDADLSDLYRGGR